MAIKRGIKFFIVVNFFLNINLSYLNKYDATNADIVLFFFKLIVKILSVKQTPWHSLQ